MKKLLTMFALVLLLGMQAWGQTTTFYVDDNYTSSTTGWGTTHFDKIQDAIDAAANGDEIRVAPGIYTENANWDVANNANTYPTQTSNRLGLLVNKSVTILGVDASDNPITSTASIAATVTSGMQSNWGTNFLISAEDVTIRGLELLGAGSSGQAYVNKAIEIIDDGFTLEHCIVGASGTLDMYGAVYINDYDASGWATNQSTWQSAIASFNIANNVLRGSFSVTNGPGTNRSPIDMTVTGNSFVNSPNSTVLNAGFYVTGYDDAIAWRIAPATMPTTISGNTFDASIGNLFLARDDDASRLPTLAQMQSFLANNTFSGSVYITQPNGALRLESAPTATTNNVQIRKTIQSAIDAATAGDILNVGAGTYTENITVSKRLSIIGSTSGGTPTSIVTASTGSVFAIQASGLSSTSPLLIKDFKVEVGTYGFNIGTGTSYLELDGVFVTGTSSAPYQGSGIKLASTASADHLTIRNSKFTRMQHGIYTDKSSSSPTPLSTLTDVLIEDTEFSENRQKGMYFEKLSNAQFNRVSLIDNGFDNTVAWGQGLDINLKYGSYSNLTFTDLYVSGNGVGTGSMGAGVNIKARDDGATYGANPATLTNVRVIGGQFIGNSHAGLRFGEPGQSNAGPTNVIVSGAQFDNNVTFGLENVTTATVDARNNWWGDNSGPYHATTNTTGTGDAVSDNVLYNPWTLRNTLTATATPYTFDADFDGNADVQMTFSTLPPGGGNVYIDRYSSIPAHWPAPPANALTNTYLILTTDMPNYSFDVNVVLTYLGSGFGANTRAAYYNEDSEEWIIIGGSYTDNGTTGLSNDDTYAFTTNHFTPFVFVNTPSTPMELKLTDMVVSDDFDESTLPTSPALTEPWQQWMGGVDLTNDWSWEYQNNTVSVIPMTVGADIFAATITLRYDPTHWQLTNPSGYTNGVKEGTLFTDASYNTFFFQMDGTASTDNTILADISVQEAGNPMVTADAVDALAHFAFKALASNPSPITFHSAAVRDNLNQAYYLNLLDDAKGRIYLGDVVRSTSTAPGYAHDAGDGELNLDDLTVWSLSYFSDVSAVNYPGSLGNYLLKYDVGPTTTNYIDGVPEPDGKIEFEDLVIFAISYGLSQNGSYPKAVGPQHVELSLANGAFDAGEWIDVPVRLSQVRDLRALSLVVEYDAQALSFEGLADGSVLPQGSPAFVRNDGDRVRIDLATIEEMGAAGSGDVVVLRFRSRLNGSGGVRIAHALARDSRNQAIGLTTEQLAAPTQITLGQNYPNPFNPSTVITYALPEAQSVEVAVFDLLGRKVRTLANAEMTAGRHVVSFDGRDDAGNTLPSGLYIYRLVAGDVAVQRSMMLAK